MTTPIVTETTTYASADQDDFLPVDDARPPATLRADAVLARARRLALAE